MRGIEHEPPPAHFKEEGHVAVVERPVDGYFARPVLQARAAEAAHSLQPRPRAHFERKAPGSRRRRRGRTACVAVAKPRPPLDLPKREKGEERGARASGHHQRTGTLL
jgi:hypothetical protein